MKKLYILLAFSLIALILNSCGSSYLRFNYNINCIDCNFNKDSLIEFSIQQEVPNSNDLKITIYNKSNKPIEIDREFSSLLEDEYLVEQPIAFDNPWKSYSYSTQFSNFSSTTSKNNYNWYLDMLYDRSSSSSSSESSTVNTSINNIIVLPPNSKYEYYIFDYMRGLRSEFLSTVPYNYIVYSSEELLEFLKPFESKNYKYIIFYRFWGDDKWTLRSLNTKVSNFKSWRE